MNKALKIAGKAVAYSAGALGLGYGVCAYFAPKLNATVKPKLHALNNIGLEIIMQNPTPVRFYFGKPTLEIFVNDARVVYSEPSIGRTPIPAQETASLPEIKLEMGALEAAQLAVVLGQAIIKAQAINIRLEAKIRFRALNIYPFGKTIKMELPLNFFMK